MKIKTILDKICVKPAEVETKTASGLFIPDNAKDAPMQGTVVSVGTGRISKDGTVVPLNVKEGDTVLFVKGAGERIEIDDTEHLIITEEQILAVVR
jgi:chaperonin GroES